MVEEKNVEKAMEHYEKVRECLTGLHEIVEINFLENNFYRKAAIDNLKALNDTVIELLKDSYPPREVRMKLRELEFDEQEMEKNFPL